MANLFTSNNSGPPSETGEEPVSDVPGASRPRPPSAFGRPRPGAVGAASSAIEPGASSSARGLYGMPSAGAAEREDTAGRALAGVRPPMVDKRKFRYDVVRGRGAGLAFEVTRDDRLSAEEACERLHGIHKMFGLHAENESLLQAFDSALFFCHTVNGSSVLNPGRSKFSVSGVTTDFDYAEVRKFLDTDFRRFFRAYADDVAEVNRRVIRDYDPSDPVKKEQWGWLHQVATERGMERHPEYAHDTAEACTSLSVPERVAIGKSKRMVIGATPNSADRTHPFAVSSADKYDSTVAESYG